MAARLIATGLALLLSVSLVSGQDSDRRERSRFGRGDRGGRGGFDRAGFGRGERGEFGRRERGGFGRGERSDSGRDERGGGRGRGRGGFDPISRLDVNQNGRIDQEEIDRIPDRFRGFMAERGLDLRDGQSVDDVRNRLRERFAEARRDRERRDADRGDGGPASRPAPPPPFRPRERERMTVDLPPTYSDVDTDLDGQIGLYEWIVARRTDLELFDRIDRNSDGLLTPKELAAWDELTKVAEGTPESGTGIRQKLVIVGASVETSSAAGEERTGQRRDDSGRDRSRDRFRGRRGRDPSSG